MTLVLLKYTVSQGSILLRTNLVINLIENLSLSLLIMRKPIKDINFGYSSWCKQRLDLMPIDRRRVSVLSHEVWVFPQSLLQL